MIYLASPFFNEEQLNFVKELEEAFDIAGISYFSPRSEGVLIEMTPEEKEKKMTEIFESNVKHIAQANLVVAVIDDWDTGTVWEMGFAYGINIPIMTISNHDYGLNVMVRQSVECHNTHIEGLVVNICEFLDGEPLSIFDELSKDVT